MATLIVIYSSAVLLGTDVSRARRIRLAAGTRFSSALRRAAHGCSAEMAASLIVEMRKTSRRSAPNGSQHTESD